MQRGFRPNATSQTKQRPNPKETSGTTPQSECHKALVNEPQQRIKQRGNRLSRSTEISRSMPPGQEKTVADRYLEHLAEHNSALLDQFVERKTDLKDFKRHYDAMTIRKILAEQKTKALQKLIQASECPFRPRLDENSLRIAGRVTARCRTPDRADETKDNSKDLAVTEDMGDRSAPTDFPIFESFGQTELLLANPKTSEPDPEPIAYSKEAQEHQPPSSKSYIEKLNEWKTKSTSTKIKRNLKEALSSRNAPRKPTAAFQKPGTTQKGNYSGKVCDQNNRGVKGNKPAFK